MRVKRSLMKAFLGDLKASSVGADPLTIEAFCGVAAGDFNAPTCDLIDAGFGLDTEGGLESLGPVGIFCRLKGEARERLWRGRRSMKSGDLEFSGSRIFRLLIGTM